MPDIDDAYRATATAALTELLEAAKATLEAMEDRYQYGGNPQHQWMLRYINRLRSAIVRVAEAAGKGR